MENVATGGFSVDTTGLDEQIAADDAAAFDASRQEVAKEPPANEPVPEGDTKTGDEEVKPLDDQKKEPEDSKPDDGTVKVGNRIFASVQDAAKEADRIIGRNAILAGDIAQLNEKVSSTASALKEKEAQLQEALRINAEWVAWQKNTEEGKAAAVPGTDPDAIAERVAAKLHQREASKSQNEIIQREVDEIAKAPNYSDVYSVIANLADKTNPFTGKPFSPREAYAFACQHKGLQNLLDTPPSVVEAPKPVEKKTNTQSIKNAAARPSGTRTVQTAPKTEWTPEDEELARAFPTF